MTDRANFAHLRYLVRDAVRSQRLDDDARDVAKLLAVQFRERARQAQSLAQDAAQTAGTTAARVTTETALPAARRASKQARRASAEAGRRAEPVVRRASGEAATAARSLADSRAGQAAAVGATAGAIASIVMGGAILAARRAGVIGEAPPREITEKSAKKAAKAVKKGSKKARNASDDVDRSDRAAESISNGRDADASQDEVERSARTVERAPSESFDIPSTAAHIAFGMALGAGFGLLHSALPREWRDPLPTLGESVAFATAVWATSYAGWLPALGLMPPPSEDDPARPMTMIAGHWIFGAVLGAGLVAGLRRDS